MPRKSSQMAAFVKLMEYQNNLNSQLQTLKSHERFVSGSAKHLIQFEISKLERQNLTALRDVKRLANRLHIRLINE